MSNGEIAFQNTRAKKIVEPSRYHQNYINRFKYARLGKYIIRERLFLELGNIKGKKILEIGCGDGEISVICSLLGANVEGVDISRKLISIAQKRAQVNHVADRCSFRIFNLEHGINNIKQYDFVISYGVLHHTQFRKYFVSIMNSLKPNGMFIMVEPVDLAKNFNIAIRKLGINIRQKSNDEKPLAPSDINYIEKNSHIIIMTGYNFTARISRLFPGDNLDDNGGVVLKSFLRLLRQVDYFVYPIFKRLYRVIFIIAKNEASINYIR